MLPRMSHLEVAKSVGGKLAEAPVGVDCGPEFDTVVTEVVWIECMKVTTTILLNNLIGVARSCEMTCVTGERVAEYYARATLDETHEYSNHDGVKIVHAGAEAFERCD